MKLAEFNSTIFLALLMDTAESSYTEFSVETQTTQNNAKLKPFKKVDSDKVLWKVTAETSMPLKTASLNLVTSEKVRHKENINHSESMEQLSKKVLKTDNK
jgi:hypothetical protein